LFASLALAVIAAPAFAQDQPQDHPPAPGSYSNSWSATKDTANGALGRMGAEIPTSSRGFVRAAAMSDMYEIAAARIALQRTQDEDVRRFAHMMIRDHSQSTMKLKRALAISNFNVPLPATFDDRHQSLIDDLRGVRGRDFDNRYADQQINAHEEAKTLLRGYAQNGDNPALRHFAGDILPTVQMHLTAARTLQNEIGPRSARYP
jgi:putative membrane protein